MSISYGTTVHSRNVMGLKKIQLETIVTGLTKRLNSSFQLFSLHMLETYCHLCCDMFEIVEVFIHTFSLRFLSSINDVGVE